MAWRLPGQAEAIFPTQYFSWRPVMIAIVDLRLADVMDRHVVSVPPDCTVATMVERMKQQPVSHVVVLDGNQPVGMFTERDLVRLLHHGAQREQQVQDLMSTPVVTLDGSLEFRSAYIQLCLSRLRHLIVLDKDGSLIGVAAERDFLGHLGMELFQSVRNLQDLVDRGVPRLPPSLPVVDAVGRMIQEKRGCVLVTDGGRLAGIFTEHQVPTVLARHQDGSAVTLGEVMRTPVTPIAVDASIARVVAQLVTDRIGYVVVVHPQDGILGTIAQSRLLESLRTAIHAEIAKRQLIEDQLRQVEARLQATLENAPNVAVQWYDRDGRVRYWNHASEVVYGWTAAEAVGKPLEQLILTAEEAAEFREQLAAIQHSGQALGPTEYLTKDRRGAPLWVESSVFPIPGEHPGESFFVCMDVDVSERKRQEQALRRESEKNAALLRHASDGVHILDSHGKIVEVSDSFCAMLGYQRDELIGMHLSQWDAGFTPELQATVFKNQFLRPVRTLFETRHRRKDGTIIDVEVSGFPVTLNGEAFLFNSSRDITERLQAERHLRTSEERLRFAMSTARQSWFDVDLRTGEIAVGSDYPLLLGYAPDQFKPTMQTWLGSIHPEDVTEVRNQIQSTLKTGGPSAVEYRRRTASGDWRWFLSTGAISERDAQGNPTRVSGVQMDITDRRAAEEELRKLSLAVEQSPSSIVVTDLEARIQYVNQAFVTNTGYSREEALGQNPRILQSGKTSRAIYDQLWAALARGEVWKGEFPNRRKDGSEYIEQVSISPVRRADGQITHYLAIKQDITELKQAEAAMRQASLHARSLIEASLDPLVTISPEGKITDVNQATETVTGRARCELIGSDFSDYFTDPGQARASYQAVFATGRVTDYPLAMRHVSGKITDVLYNATLYRDANGDIAGVFAAARDVTERKRNEADLNRYRQDLEAMVERRTAELQETHKRLLDTQFARLC